jgi:phage protein D
MNLQEKQRPWPNQADHEIALAVFASNGLSSEVEDTQVQQTELATTMQNETDIQFLRRLAYRNGYECRVRAGVGQFRSPDLAGPSQKLLAMGYGPEANLATLTVLVDGTPFTAPQIRRVDPVTKQEDTKTLADLPEHKLGADTLSDLRTELPDGHFLVTRRTAASAAEMQAWLRAAQRQAGRFVTVQGEVDSRAYQAVLHSGRPVTIKAAGARYSGTYYVSQVSHHFTVDGYTQSFGAYRNALGVTGAENFAAPPALVPIPPGTGDSTTRPDGNRVLPGRQVGTVITGGQR